MFIALLLLAFLAVNIAVCIGTSILILRTMQKMRPKENFLSQECDAVHHIAILARQAY